MKILLKNEPELYKASTVLSVVPKGQAVNDPDQDWDVDFPKPHTIEITELLPHDAWMSWGVAEIDQEVAEAMQHEVGYSFTQIIDAYPLTQEELDRQPKKGI